MKRTLLHTALGAVFAATATMASLAVAAPPTSVGSAPFDAPPATAPGKNKLLCFDGVSDESIYGGSCTLVGRGAMGPAILDLTAEDADGSYAGVYYANGSIYGEPLADITHLGFHYVADDEDLTPGNLRISLPVDENGDGVTEMFAFIDVFYCPGTDGVVDVINDEACGIWYNDVQYANWDAFVAAFPDALVADDNFAFVIAERPPGSNAASYRVSAVKIGKPGRNP